MNELRNDPMYDGIPDDVVYWPQLRDFINDVRRRMGDDEVFIMRCWNDGSGVLSVVKEVDAYGDSNPFSVNDYDSFVIAEDD
jgi:hypothetical protein